MSMRDKHIERIAEALNQPRNKVQNKRKELSSGALNTICKKLGLENEKKYFTAAEARTELSQLCGEDRYYTGRQRMTWEELKGIADELQNL